MTSIVILPIPVGKVEIGHRWRIMVFITTEILRGRFREGRDIKGVVMRVRLLELIHYGTEGLWREEIRQESRMKVAVNAMTYSLR